MKKKIKKVTPDNSFTEFMLYTTPNGKVKVEIFLRDESIWLTQDKIALLFGVQRQVTAEIARAFSESEFEKCRVIQDKSFESDFDKEERKIYDHLS